MKTVAISILFLILVWDVAGAHPIHVSITNMEVKPDSCRIEYSIRLFYDDFQAMINYNYNTQLDFSMRNRLTNQEQQVILEYLSGAFALVTDNQDTLVSYFDGWKKEDQSLWFYFHSPVQGKVNNLQILNTLMLNLFDDQSNLVILEGNGSQNGWEFNKRNTRQLIQF